MDLVQDSSEQLEKSCQGEGSILQCCRLETQPRMSEQSSLLWSFSGKKGPHTWHRQLLLTRSVNLILLMLNLSFRPVLNLGLLGSKVSTCSCTLQPKLLVYNNPKHSQWPLESHSFHFRWINFLGSEGEAVNLSKSSTHLKYSMPLSCTALSTKI